MKKCLLLGYSKFDQCYCRCQRSKFKARTILGLWWLRVAGAQDGRIVAHQNHDDISEVDADKYVLQSMQLMENFNDESRLRIGRR